MNRFAPLLRNAHQWLGVQIQGIRRSGDADKNLDWLCREAQAFTILNGTERAEGNLYAFFVVPANV